MKIEHFALNVTNPDAIATWYVKNLGLKIVKQLAEPPCTHFLADSGGTVLLEIYNNPPDQVPDYAEMDPLLLHIAFVSENPDADRVTLTDAGATFVEEIRTDDGSYLVMMRDPWGLPLQLCKRGTPMLTKL